MNMQLKYKDNIAGSSKRIHLRDLKNKFYMDFKRFEMLIYNVQEKRVSDKKCTRNS